MISHLMIESFLFLPRIVLDGIRIVHTDWNRFMDRFSQDLPLYHVVIDWNIRSNNDIQARAVNYNTMGPDGRPCHKSLISPSAEEYVICSQVQLWVRNAYYCQYVTCSRSEDVKIAAKVNTYTKIHWLCLRFFQHGPAPDQSRSVREMLELFSLIDSLMTPTGLMLEFYDSDLLDVTDNQLLRHHVISCLQMDLNLHDCTKHKFDVFWNEVLGHLCNCSHVEIRANFKAQHISLFLEVLVEQIQRISDFSTVPNGILISFFHDVVQAPLFQNLRPRSGCLDLCSYISFPACAFVTFEVQDTSQDVYFLRTMLPDTNVKLIHIKHKFRDFVWLTPSDEE